MQPFSVLLLLLATQGVLAKTKCRSRSSTTSPSATAKQCYTERGTCLVQPVPTTTTIIVKTDTATVVHKTTPTSTITLSGATATVTKTATATPIKTLSTPAATTTKTNVVTTSRTSTIVTTETDNPSTTITVTISPPFSPVQDTLPGATYNAAGNLKRDTEHKDWYPEKVVCYESRVVRSTTTKTETAPASTVTAYGPTSTVTVSSTVVVTSTDMPGTVTGTVTDMSTVTDTLSTTSTTTTTITSTSTVTQYEPTGPAQCVTSNYANGYQGLPFYSYSSYGAGFMFTDGPYGLSLEGCCQMCAASNSCSMFAYLTQPGPTYGDCRFIMAASSVSNICYQGRDSDVAFTGNASMGVEYVIGNGNCGFITAADTS